MTPKQHIIAELAKLQTKANAGFALAFHIDYTRPTLLFQTYPEAWISEYSEKGMVMSDPTVHWGFENDGALRWSELAGQDSAGVLDLAATHGMKYGLICAVAGGDTRSICSFSREDREYDGTEQAALLDATQALHTDSTGLDPFTLGEIAEMAALGINVSQPGGK